MNKKLIYVVDDEQNIRDLIKTYLIKEDFEVLTFCNGETALQSFCKKEPDMLVIDIMMPGMDGYALCREIRKKSDVPIIMVSAKDDEIDKILGLELGGDDYISKPFSPRELVVRIKTIFRRIKSKVDEAISTDLNIIIKCKDILIYTEQRSVVCDNIEIDFTTKEYELLLYLTKNKNKVFNREQLIYAIWNYDFIGDTRAIDDLVKRIRKKLSLAGSTLEIVTVWGYGYKVSE